MEADNQSGEQKAKRQKAVAGSRKAPSTFEKIYGGRLLYWLLFIKLQHYVAPFRIFRYVTFRTAFASLTALFTALIVGPLVIGRQ